jgi:hypothetical protein
MSHNSGMCNSAYGCFDQRPLDVVKYWLANKHGAEFIIVDAWAGNWDGAQARDLLRTTEKFGDAAAWIHAQTNLPLWWAEDYFFKSNDKQYEAAGLASMLYQHVRSGAAVSLRWAPQAQPSGEVGQNWFTNTMVRDGGKPLPPFYVYKAFREHFGPGTQLYRVSSSSPDVEVLASATKTLLINKRPSSIIIDLNDHFITMHGYEVRIQEDNS